MVSADSARTRRSSTSFGSGRHPSLPRTVGSGALDYEDLRSADRCLGDNDSAAVQSFRSRLSSASGFQSAQFREVEAVLGRRDHAGEGARGGHRDEMAEHLVPGSPARTRVEAAMARPSVWDSALRYCHVRGHRMPDDVLDRDVTTPWEPREDVQSVLVSLHHSDPESALVCEALVDLDEGLGEWRYRHVKMVERTIGRKPGTGDLPVWVISPRLCSTRCSLICGLFEASSSECGSQC